MPAAAGDGSATVTSSSHRHSRSTASSKTSVKLGGGRPVAVGGARELVPLLAKELRSGGDPGAVASRRTRCSRARVDRPGRRGRALRAASRAATPIVAVTEGGARPYVLDTTSSASRPAKGSRWPRSRPLLARVLGPRALVLAARLPVLREAVVSDLIPASARQNGLIGGGGVRPRRRHADPDHERGTARPADRARQRPRARFGPLAASCSPSSAPDFGFRRIAAELLDLLPVAGWIVKGGVAFSGTRAIGEAARQRFHAT